MVNICVRSPLPRIGTAPSAVCWS